jgi:hypothetical protein
LATQPFNPVKHVEPHLWVAVVYVCKHPSV